MRFNSSNLSINRRTPVGATDFLRRDDKLAALMPAIERMAALQKDCATALPAMFKYCEILAFEGGQLTLALPNASLAAKLKQQIPKLQETLARRGWQVQGVKLKVQMTKPAAIKEQMRALSLPEAAVTAFDELGGDAGGHAAERHPDRRAQGDGGAPPPGLNPRCAPPGVVPGFNQH